VSPHDRRRALLAMAYRLREGKAPSKTERQYLADALSQIAYGEDANKALGVKLRRGEKSKDAVARRRISMILHWVAAAVEPDPVTGRKLSVERACERAVSTIVPAAKRAFPGADGKNYEVEYLLRCWKNPKYRHMRSVTRKYLDPDSPYS